MKKYTNRLYLILYPNHALVASQLEPNEFARHYQIGSMRHYSGKLVFAEIDVNFRHEYFDIEFGLSQLIPHEDGSPKATKFISSYRVLEHIDFDSIKNLYITTAEGQILELKSQPFSKEHRKDVIRVIAEISPLSMLVLTNLNTEEFSHYITDPKNSKGAPKLFFCQLDLNTKDFLDEFEKNPLIPPPFSFLHPSKLRDAILELQQKAGKKAKGLALRAPLGSISYKKIRHGFWFASHEKTLFFPLPELKEIEKKNFKFWKSM